MIWVIVYNIIDSEKIICYIKNILIIFYYKYSSKKNLKFKLGTENKKYI